MLLRGTRGAISALAFAVMCVSPRSAGAQRIELASRGSGSERVPVQPGSVLNVVFRFTAWPVSASIETRTDLPPGWVGAMDDEGTPAPPAGGSFIRFVVLRVPAGAPAGAYVVRYSARAGASTRWITDSVVVRVAPLRRVELLLADAPEWVLAGHAYTAGFRLSNRGNVPTRVRLTVTTSHAMPVRLHETVVDLPLAADRMVRASVQTPETSPMIAHRLHVTAQIEGSTTPPSRVHSTVEIVPARARRTGAETSLPAALTFRQAGTDRKTDARSVELRAAGTLGRRGTTRLSLLLRTPQAAGAFAAQRDQYSLSVDAPRYRLRLGDHLYSQSPLLQSGQLRFGGAAELVAGPLHANAFIHRDRFGDVWLGADTNGVQRGGGLEIRGADNALGLQYNEWPGSRPASAWLMRGSVGVTRARVEAEYGLGANANGSRGDALAIDMRATLPRVSAHATHRNIAAEFPGALSNTSYDRASLTLTPWRRLNLSAHYDAHETAALQVPEWSSKRLVGYRARSAYGNLFALHYAIRELYNGPQRSSVQGRETRQAREEAAGISLQAALAEGKLRLRPSVEAGVIEITAATAPHQFRRYRMEASLAVLGQSVSAFMEKFDGGRLYASPADTGSSAGVAASLRFGSNTRARLSWFSSRRERPVTSMVSSLDGSIERDLMRGHVVSLRWQQALMAPNGVQSRATLLAEYRIPFGMPVQRQRGGAQVTGRVFDVETGRPLANTLVRIRDRVAVTDARGRVTIAGLQQERQYLQVDLRTLRAGFVTVHPNPRPVLGESQRSVSVDIGVVRGARLDGHVRIFEPVPAATAAHRAPPVRDAGGVANALLSLTREGEELRAITDQDGAFSITGLRPGTWTVRVAAASLPPQHFIEHESVLLELTPGQSAELDVRVLPRRRTVRMLTEGELPVASRDAGAAPAPLPATLAAPRIETTRPAQTRHTYTVTRWDSSLEYVAYVMYGDSALWPRIWEANRHQLETPSSLRVGQRLLVPDEGPLTEAEIRERDVVVGTKGAISRASAGGNRYTVTRWDVGLSDIAAKVYGDASLWPKIWLANTQVLRDGNSLPAGVRLAIPAPGPLTTAEIAARNEYLRRFGRAPR